ncbi:MAG: macro domain-containing protein [Bacteroidia bacterium]|nr:macro domain-containing protein [Bacteroidia bacterium]
MHTLSSAERSAGSGIKGEREKLASCYRNSLILAVENDCHTIAFPNISTGIYRFPKEEAAVIAVRTVKEFLDTETTMSKVTFVCFDEENYNAVQKIISA